MNSTPLIYLVDDEDESRIQLWQAFQSRRPDCLLYSFSSVPEMLEHLLEDYSKPTLLIISTDSYQAPLLVLRFLQNHYKGHRTPVILLADAGYDTLPFSAVLPKIQSYSDALILVDRLSKVMLMEEEFYGAT